MPRRKRNAPNADDTVPIAADDGGSSAKRAKKNNATPRPTAAETSTNNDSNQNNNPTNDDSDTKSGRHHVSDMVEQITEVLRFAYFDIKERLQINTDPICLQNLEFCSVSHYKNGMNHNPADGYLINEAIQLIGNDRLPLFMRFVSNITLLNRFPGPKLMLKLFEIILVIFFFFVQIVCIDYMGHLLRDRQ